MLKPLKKDNCIFHYKESIALKKEKKTICAYTCFLSQAQLLTWSKEEKKCEFKLYLMGKIWLFWQDKEKNELV